MNKILVFIPTLDEVENVGLMCEKIMVLPLPLDLLFADDASPDGTGQELDRLAKLHPRMTVLHRPDKLGIGRAHQDGIAYAYRHDYEILITMDCDFTHDPARIPDLLAAREGYAVVIGSRFLLPQSLPGWTLFRKFLTRLGHFLTRNLLQMKYDATGAFRLYDLRVISEGLFSAVRSRSYSFFFESLFVLASNGCKIKEIPISLPSRTYGHSKLTLKEVARSVLFLLKLSLERWANPGRFRAGRPPDRVREDLTDPQDWAPYWQRKKEVSGFVYEVIAAGYRNLVLRPRLQSVLRENFRQGDKLLHAGCGSGQVDSDLQDHFHITAIDVSRDALDLYSRYNPRAFRIEQADVLALPYEDGRFDGVYNLGVVEHFTHDDIRRILRELHRVLRPEGKIIIFWPHSRATSVFVLKLARSLLSTLWRKPVKFHPDEISLLDSKKQAQEFFSGANFELLRYRMDWGDGFIQAVLVGRKPA